MAVDDIGYRRFAPPPGAHELVDHLWVVRYPAGAVSHEVVLPDGHGLVVVAVGTPGVHVDPLTQRRTPDASGVRGLATRATVREQRGPAARVGAQLDPLALARLGVARPVTDRLDPVETLLSPEVATACAVALEAGQDEDAAHLLGGGLAARFRPEQEDPTLALLEPVVREVLESDGLVRSSDVARNAGLAVGTLHRWVVEHLGVAPDVFLAAVRFSAFVRDAVGPGPVRPEDVLGAIRWYVQAAYPPREVERFTGNSLLELRRLERGIAEALGTAVGG